MNAWILSIGNELLVGDTINTNAAWMGTQLLQKNIRVERTLVIPDNEDDMNECLDQAFSKPRLILITGGLGPTHDDITKKVLCSYFDVGLKRDEESLERNRGFFEARGIRFSPSNYGQSDVPENATVMQNKMGTAQGMWIEHNDCILVAMPGVPREMKYLMEKQVLPRLETNGNTYVHYLKTMGIGESTLSDEVLEGLDAYLVPNIELAFLPQVFGVNLRIIARGESLTESKMMAAKLITFIRNKASDYIYSENQHEDLSEAVGKLLLEKGKTLSVAESCTSGMIGARLGDIPGSSAYFDGGIISYSNNVKMNQLGVSSKTLEKFGAVSSETAAEMANGVRKLLKTDFALSVTGIAGPTGGTIEKPVGLVWFGLSSQEKTFTWSANFARDRNQNRERSVLMALDALRRELSGIETLPYEAKKNVS